MLVLEPLVPPNDRLLGYVRPYARAFAVALACMGLSSLVEPAFPVLMKHLRDDEFASLALDEAGQAVGKLDVALAGVKELTKQLKRAGLMPGALAGVLGAVPGEGPVREALHR
mgnify:CR=1 FL=1